MSSLPADFSKKRTSVVQVNSGMLDFMNDKLEGGSGRSGESMDLGAGRLPDDDDLSFFSFESGEYERDEQKIKAKIAEKEVRTNRIPKKHSQDPNDDKPSISGSQGAEIDLVRVARLSNQSFASSMFSATPVEMMRHPDRRIKKYALRKYMVELTQDTKAAKDFLKSIAKSTSVQQIMRIGEVIQTQYKISNEDRNAMVGCARTLFFHDSLGFKQLDKEDVTQPLDRELPEATLRNYNLPDLKMCQTSADRMSALLVVLRQITSSEKEAKDYYNNITTAESVQGVMRIAELLQIRYELNQMTKNWITICGRQILTDSVQGDL